MRAFFSLLFVCSLHRLMVLPFTWVWVPTLSMLPTLPTISTLVLVSPIDLLSENSHNGHFCSGETRTSVRLKKGLLKDFWQVSMLPTLPAQTGSNLMVKNKFKKSHSKGMIRCKNMWLPCKSPLRVRCVFRLHRLIPILCTARYYALAQVTYTVFPGKLKQISSCFDGEPYGLCLLAFCVIWVVSFVLH